MGIELPDTHIPAILWMKYLILNVDNDTITDGEFREFVKKTLPTVANYSQANKDLVESGRTEKDVKVVHASGSQNYQDTPRETFQNK